MARRTRFRQLLATGLLLASSASALPTDHQQAPPAQDRRQIVYGAPRPWVTVDASGSATTVTPTVTSASGAATASTISPPPAALTSVGTYTLYPTSAAVQTSTGLSPVATASSSAGDGAFLVCNVDHSVDAPFCQPKSGSQVNPGKTYYITWSDSYFANISTPVQLHGDYLDGSHTGFSSPGSMPAGRGFYAWSIPVDILAAGPGRPQPLSSFNVSFSLSYAEDLYGNERQTVPGPTIIVTSTPISDGPQPGKGGGGGGTNVVAIAVPVVVVVVFLALAGLCVWSWRRHGTVPVLGALKRRSTGGGAGYGVRQSAAQRTGTAGGGGVPAVVQADGKGPAAGGVELTDRDSWSPTTAGTSPPGRNVFREELERQERER